MQHADVAEHYARILDPAPVPPDGLPRAFLARPGVRAVARSLDEAQLLQIARQSRLRRVNPAIAKFLDGR